MTDHGEALEAAGACPRCWGNCPLGQCEEAARLEAERIDRMASQADDLYDRSREPF